MSWWRRRAGPVSDEVAADPDAPLIRLENVSKVFRGDADEEVRALDSVSVSIARGDRTLRTTAIASSVPYPCVRSQHAATVPARPRPPTQ